MGEYCCSCRSMLSRRSHWRIWLLAWPKVIRSGINSFKEKITQLKQYLSYRHIPDDMQASILFFHHCRWKDSQTLDERETLSILPEPLQLDISFAVKQRVIRLVPILDTLPDIVQKRIAHCLILQVYSLTSSSYDLQSR